MSDFDFKKDGASMMMTALNAGLSRGAQGSGNATGQIAQGEVATITFDGDDAGTAQVKSKRSGAVEILRSIDTAFDALEVIVSGTTLSVTGTNAVTGSITYWVF